jgi:hypothetical protein
LIALPVAGAAQTTGTTPPQEPTAQTQPQQPPAQPPTAAEPQPGQPGQVDANAAKKHLSEARDTLSQITSMPEAAKLQGDSRTQVSQLISGFNELITTQANWRDAYSKVDATLTSLIGPETSDPAATGTTGTTGTTATTGTAGAASTAIDPAIRTKLVEFRAHLKLFEKAAGGGEPASGAMAPSAAPASTSNPASPAPTPTTATATTPEPATASQPPSSAGAVGTSGVTPSPTGTMASMDQAKATERVAHAEADKHLDAIDAILNKSTTGTLTKAETSELKKHVELLRALLKQGR